MADQDENSRRRTRELTRLRVKKFREIGREMPGTSRGYRELQIQALQRDQIRERDRITQQSNSDTDGDDDDRHPLEVRDAENQILNAAFHLNEELDEQVNNYEELQSEEEIENDDDAVNLAGDDNALDRDSDEETSRDENENEQYDTLGEIRKWAVMNPPIPHSRLEGLLNILRNDYSNLPKSAKTFLGTNSATYDIENFIENVDGQFVYFGITGNLKKTINPAVHEVNSIELIFNVDGIPLFKSSSKEVWPILCKVFNHPDVYAPFAVAIYCGDGKPRNVHRYLEKFVEEINELQRHGFFLGEQHFDVNIKAFICDRPARSFLKCIINHGGFYACERCTVRGNRKENRTIYSATLGEPRSDATFRAQTNSHHHHGISPLTRIEPPIDFINHFVLDSMHLVFLVL